jgi:hypothetical protein
MIHEIIRHDLQFRRVPVEFHSTRGVPQTASVSIGMPRIPFNVINGVFYLYRDRKDALAGKDPGGTGFIVRYDGALNESVPENHFYGVTNWHVACDGPWSTIRLNAKDGGTDIIELGPEQWSFLPGKYDVAVVPLSLDDKIHDVSSVSTRLFAGKPGPGSPYGRLGVGEDVFMIGLFVDHDGATTNVPSARFGNISMLPNPKATIEQPTKYRGESFVVDMHSRTGFSGSPVYVYRTFGADLTESSFGTSFDSLEIDNWDSAATGGRLKGRLKSSQLFELLGIHWGQFPERWELHNANALKEARKDLIVEGGYVKGMSGMTCVIPAWNILEVLKMPELVALREPEIADAKKRNLLRVQPERPSAKPSPVAESVERRDAPAAADENPQHREDFTSLLNAAAKKPPQGD